MSELAKALAKAQATFPTIARDKTVTVKTKTGGEYTFAYAPFDLVMRLVGPVLTANELALSQLLTHINGIHALRTVLMHASGEVLEDVCPLPMSGAPLSAQEFGSLVTYMRRYAVVSLLGIATEEDDDGNAATGNAVAARETRARGNGEPELISDTVQKTFVDVTEAARTATRPSEMPVHFGKNKGTPLGDLTPRQLSWYANEWKVQQDASDYDHDLKQAAIALLAGHDSLEALDPAAGTPFAA